MPSANLPSQFSDPQPDTEPSNPNALPYPFSASPPHTLELIAQGAESLLYKTTFLNSYNTSSATTTTTTPISSISTPTLAALKHRPRKPYRHPTLDARLTRTRLLSEARALLRCRRAGLRVPGVLAVDVESGVLVLEWIAGETVRDVLRAWAVSPQIGDENRHEGEEAVRAMMRKIGEAVAGLHAIGVVHGDLTTGNLIVSPDRLHTTSATISSAENGASTFAGEIYVLDFGLVSSSGAEEDKAVDLYVLERAFSSTHPGTEVLFHEEVLGAYRTSHAGAKAVLRRLEDVRMRGRKRSMIG